MQGQGTASIRTGLVGPQPKLTIAETHPSFHSARIYFFTKSIMLSSQTQKENPLPAMFS